MPLSTVPAEHLLTLINGTAAVTWSLGADGSVMDAPQWCELTGQAPHEVEGTGWLDAVHPEDRRRVDAAWTTAVAHAQHFNTDYRIRCADGIYRWFNARGVAVRNPGGDIERWVGICLEIPGMWRFGATAGVQADRLRETTGGTLSPETLRAARGLANWSAADLASRAGVSLSTVRRLESEERESHSRRTSTEGLARAFREAGISFVQVDGQIVGVLRK